LSDDRFRAFPQFDQPELSKHARSRQRFGDLLGSLFPASHFKERVAKALVEQRAVNLKELLESFEFHHRVRRRVRAPIVADLFCGHGLTGLIFAMAEKSVERVILVDKRRPPSFTKMHDIICELAPWVRDKVEYREQLVEAANLPAGTTVLAVHACGPRTDLAIETAAKCKGALALMPCCYRSAARPGPRVLLEALGTERAIDVDRTYRIERLGLQVDWASIPAAVTPMNRVLIGWRSQS